MIIVKAEESLEDLFIILPISISQSQMQTNWLLLLLVEKGILCIL